MSDDRRERNARDQPARRPAPPNGYRSERETREALTDMWRGSGSGSGMDRATADRLAEQVVRKVADRIEKES